MSKVSYVPFDLRIGAIVVTQIGPIEHVGLVVGYTRLGEPIVASISLWRGFVQETLSQFANAQGTYKANYPSHLSGNVVVARAYSVAKKQYHLLNWNCEHFVRHAHGLPLESPQIAKAILAASAIFAAVALARA